MPRPNGYQSLHTSVISEHGFPFEVQIRTEEMHRRAEEGIAAHWKYKEGRVGDHRDERYFQWMRQLLEVQQEVRDPQEFLQNLKIDLYPGGGLHLHAERRGALAAARRDARSTSRTCIHTDVGNQCVGARINGKMVPLRTRLQNGDIVEIITQSGHKPSRDWLTFVVTLARAQQDQARAPGRGARAQHRARPASVREGGAALRPQSRRRCSRATELAKFATRVRRAEAATNCSRTSATASSSARTVLQKSVPGGQLKEKAADSAVVSVVKRVLRPGATSRQDQGARHRRRDGVPREVLQSDSRREDRRLHHARQGRVGALRGVPERVQPDVRSRAPHRRRVGQRRRPIRRRTPCG